MANSAPILGLRPGWWILILSSILVAAIIVIPIVVVKTSESTTTPGGPVINVGGDGSNGGAGGTTQGPTPTSTPTISTNTTVSPTLTPTLTPKPNTTVRPTTVPPPTLPPLPPFNHTDKRPDMKLQIFHLSDIHGYIGQKRYAGTFSTPDQNGKFFSYPLNADWGDFLSMVAHARANAAATGTEFLLFDTGDLVDGAAYADVTTPRGVNMIAAISQARYDGFAPGNHDLGYADTISLLQATSNETNMITSNIGFDGKPLGASYRVLNLKSGYRVLVLGFLYDFTGAVGPNVSVTTVLDGKVYDENNNDPQPNTNLIFSNQPYFKQAMAEPGIDLIVTLGHIPIIPFPGEPDYFLQIFNTIRKLKPQTPVIQLGGHAHQYRNISNREVYSVTTGKPGVFLMETNNQFRTIGTVNLRLGPNPVANGTRMVIERSVHVVTNQGAMAATVNRTLTPDTFSTPVGNAMKAQLKQWATDYGLDRVRACWNQSTYVLNGKPPNNIYPWWTDEVVPTYFLPNTPSIQYFLAASASLRSNLNNGTVTEEDIFNILPFADDVMYFKNLTIAQFQQALYHAQAKTFGKVSIRKRTECVHEERPDIITAHAPADIHEMFVELPNDRDTLVKSGHSYTVPKQYQTQSTTRTRMHQMQLPSSAPKQDVVFDRPYMYYGTRLPVLKPVPAMYGRTFFTYADIAGGYQTPPVAPGSPPSSDDVRNAINYQNDIDNYNLPRNRTDQIAVVNAFFEQYGSRTFDLITSRYHAVNLLQNLIFPAKNNSAVYGFPTGDAAQAQIYPGNSNAYPGAPINATHLLRTYLFNNYKCANLATSLV